VVCGVSLGNSWSSLGAIITRPHSKNPTKHKTQNTNTTHIPIPKVQAKSNNTRIKSHTQHKTTQTHSHPKHTLPVIQTKTTLHSVLFCFPPHPMDCWSSPLPLHDEFEKLVIRMNPPRLAFLPPLILFLLLCTAGSCVCTIIVLHVVFLLPCRVAVDNISSRTDTVIKVPNSPLIGLVFSALQKGLCVTVFCECCCRLTAQTGAGVCWKWFRFSLT